jgi:hypothetical protein
MDSVDAEICEIQKKNLAIFIQNLFLHSQQTKGA